MKRILLLLGLLLALPLWAAPATNAPAKATLRELRRVETQMVRRNRALMQADLKHRQVPNPDWRPGDDPTLALLWEPGPVAAARMRRGAFDRDPAWLNDVDDELRGLAKRRQELRAALLPPPKAKPAETNAPVAASVPADERK